MMYLLFLLFVQLCVCQPVLDIYTFGVDDYTKLLLETSVADDWKNVIGQNVYRNLVIHNREFASRYNNISYPNVPSTTDYNMSERTGTTHFTKYSLSGSVEFLLCIDKDLLSRCSYMTKVNIKNNTAKAVYSVVTRNIYNYTMSEWYLNAYASSSGMTPSPYSDYLVTSTGLIDLIDKPNTYLLSESTSVYYNSDLPDCKSYSAINYASTVAHDSMYPISPVCYGEAVTNLLAYNIPNHVSYSPGSCSGVAYAIYDDPGYNIGGPLVLEMYNFYGYNVIIAGLASHSIGSSTNLDTTSDNVVSDIEAFYYNLTSIPVYKGGSYLPLLEPALCTSSTLDAIETYYYTQVCNCIYSWYNTYNISGTQQFTINIIFNNNDENILFIPTSLYAASSVVAYPYIKPIEPGHTSEAVATLGEQLGNINPSYLKTKTYCESDVSFNLTYTLTKYLDQYLSNMSYVAGNTTIGHDWLNNFGLLITSCTLGAAAPIAYAKSVQLQRISVIVSTILVIFVACAGITINAINYNNVTKNIIEGSSTNIKTDVANNGYTVVSIVKVNYSVELRNKWTIIGWICSFLVFPIILSINISLCSIANGITAIVIPQLLGTLIIVITAFIIVYLAVIHILPVVIATFVITLSILLSMFIISSSYRHRQINAGRDIELPPNRR